MLLVLTDVHAQGYQVHCAYPAFPAGLSSLTLLLMPPGDLRPTIALRVSKMFPADLPEEFLQAGAYP